MQRRAAGPRFGGVDLSHLGTPTGPMARVHGGFANRMYRHDTDQGSFAVKELNLLDRRWTYRIEDVFRLERAAFAAGIPMPEPVSATHDTLVHRWVEGEKVPEARMRGVPGADRDDRDPSMHVRSSAFFLSGYELLAARRARHCSRVRPSSAFGTFSPSR